jgi:hypothetical protein
MGLITLKHKQANLRRPTVRWGIRYRHRWHEGGENVPLGDKYAGLIQRNVIQCSQCLRSSGNRGPILNIYS